MSDGTRLGEWTLGPLLGSGDTSSVHLAIHAEDPEKRAAIKVLSRQNTVTLARFRREAEILESIDHPNIVHFGSLDLEDVLPYIEMEFVPGTSIKDLLLDGPPPVAVALRWAAQVLDALQYLHARGVHHRDLSTSNLVVDGDRVCLVDFGLAKGTGHAELVAGSRIGAVATAPPEWIGEKPVSGDVWDLYAFGVVLFEILTGTEGFPANPSEPEHLAAAHVMAQKRKLEALDPGEEFPEALCTLVRELTARDPKSRPKSVKDVRAKLLQIRPPAREPVRTVPPPENLSVRYHQASAVGYVVTAVLAVSAGLLFLAVAWRLLGAGLGWWRH